jgi:hypothetical protein
MSVFPVWLKRGDDGFVPRPVTLSVLASPTFPFFPSLASTLEGEV